MARFSRIEVAQTMGETGLVPLFYHPDIEVCKSVVTAICKGGARILEFTNRGDYAHEVFGALNKWAKIEFPELIIGVGSVIDAGTASLYMQLGANFIVSPSFHEEVARVCNKRKVLWSPGCGTLTEISKAEELGAEIVKLFPGAVYGPGFIKAIKGPSPWTNIMPTGGVSPNRENLEGWFNAGAYCVGMGSKLIVKTSAGDYDLERIEELTRMSLEMIKDIRK